jgi:hypothetical protein
MVPTDVGKLLGQQVWLRHQIEAFAATPEHLTTHTRRRTKAVQLGQVGIRCRHCAHLPLILHQKGTARALCRTASEHIYVWNQRVLPVSA